MGGSTRTTRWRRRSRGGGAWGGGGGALEGGGEWGAALEPSAGAVDPGDGAGGAGGAGRVERFRGDPRSGRAGADEHGGAVRGALVVADGAEPGDQGGCGG